MDTYTFAGFTWPRPVGLLPAGSLIERLERRRSPRVTGPYITAPRPLSTESTFYLDSDFAPGLRWRWCDEVNRSIRCSGWFCDALPDGTPDTSGETLRGIVFTLPAGRGFVIGWSMGPGMIAALDKRRLFEDADEAAHAANELAERAAEEALDESWSHFLETEAEEKAAAEAAQFRYACPSCGSTAVLIDACAAWDMERAAWALAGCQDTVTCQVCGAEWFESDLTKVPRHAHH